MSNQNVPPGLMQPTMASYPPGASSPAQAAKLSADSASQRQANLNQMAAGSKRRRYRGGADAVTVPQMQMQYTPTGGVGTNPNDQIKGLSSTSMQSTAWAANDSQAAKMGGSRRKYKKGGNPDWLWGCYSGGRKRTNRRKSRRNKNKKRTRRHRRH